MCSSLSGWNLYIDELSVSQPAAVSEINIAKKEFAVYPNPASSTLTITQTSGLPKGNNTANVYNMQGQLLMQHAFTGCKTEIDVQHLESGLYVLKIESEEGFWLKKFIKK